MFVISMDNRAIGIALLIMAFGLIIILTVINQGSSSPTSSSNITVTGIISTTGAGTSPTAVFFNGQEATVNSNGQYSISLPNFQVYSVSIRWEALLGTVTGTCNAAPFVLASTSGTATYSGSC